MIAREREGEKAHRVPVGALFLFKDTVLPVHYRLPQHQKNTILNERYTTSKREKGVVNIHKISGGYIAYSGGNGSILHCDCAVENSGNNPDSEGMNLMVEEKRVDLTGAEKQRRGESLFAQNNRWS